MKIKPFEIQVRFSDLDILGHVNNAVYLSYFEMARIHYFTALAGPNWDWVNEGTLLVRHEIAYHLPIVLQNKPLIYVQVKEIGNKSFSVSYYIEVDGKKHTSGSSTLVCFNSTTKKSIEIPAKMKEHLLNLM